MSDLKGVPKRVILTGPERVYPTTLIAYADLIVQDGMVVKDRYGKTREATPEDLASCKTLTPDEAKIAVDVAAWRGEPPAEGTRRAIVLEAIKKGDVLSDAEALEIADTVEIALLGSEPPSDRAKELELRETVQRTFAEQQRRSHHDLRERDPKFAEYHRGAEVAYALMAERFGGESAAVATGQAWPEGSPERRAIEMRAEITHVPPEAWQGTPPAQGTRRALILDTIREHDGDSDEGQLELADAIEMALLKGALGRRLTAPSGVDQLVEARRFIVRAGNILDEISIPRTSEGGTVLNLSERVRLAVKRVLTEEEAKRLLASTVDAQQSAMDKIRAEGKVEPGTKELVIVLEDVSDPDGPSEYRFIELEDQDGRGVGSFPMRPSSCLPLKEIVIPYGRDDAWVSEVAYQAAGAATRPLLEDHPDYVFPAERVGDAVAELLSTFGISRACTGCQEEQLEHGRKEVGDDVPAPQNSRPIEDYDLVEAARVELMNRIERGRMANQGLVFLVWRLG